MKIGIVPNDNKKEWISVTNELISYLDGKAELVLCEKYKGNFNGVIYAVDVYKASDIIIVIGGDGTIINSALPCSENEKPALGINLGRVGFMSEIEVSNIKEAVDLLISGKYILEKRMMLDIAIKKEDGSESVFSVLNDIVVQKNNDAKLISMELFSNKEKISEYVADGLIVSTPTGSTGYNLSAGGPVVNPLMDLVVATAICPHMLTARPAVLPVDKEIVIKLGNILPGSAIVVADGENIASIGGNDEIVITKSSRSLDLIKIIKRSFYDTLVEKLL